MERGARLKSVVKWANRLRFVFVGLAVVGMIGLHATIMPDFDYEMGQVYIFAGIAYTGYAGILLCAVTIFCDWIRDKAHQKELFDWARKWRKIFAGTILIGAVGEIIFDAVDWKMLAGMFERAAEIGIICIVICIIALCVEQQIRKREQRAR